jgi:hypothetical protein
MTSETTIPADSRDMYAVHNMLRRGFGELPAIARDVPPGADRAELVANHGRLLVTILITHHEAEDAVLWPKLLARCPEESKPDVESMERQHRHLHTFLDAVSEKAASYRDSRDAKTREDFAQSVDALLAPLEEHLCAEEREILPLIDRYLTNAEWAAVGEHGLPQLTPRQVPLVFGMMLRVATEEQRALLAQNVPSEVFSHMIQVAPQELATYERRLCDESAS